MPVEEQTQYDDTNLLWAAGNKRVAQRLFIPHWTVTKLAFYLYKQGAPTDPLTFTIRRVSDDGLIVSKVWGNAAELPTEVALIEATLDAPTLVNEEVRICVEYNYGDVSNGIRASHKGSDVKPAEYITQYIGDTWNPTATEDLAYRYTYQEEYAIDVGDAPIPRASQFPVADYTIINKGNPANLSGILTRIDFYVKDGEDLAGCIVGTFYTTNGNRLKCRDSATIGAVVGGSRQGVTEDSESNPLAIAVEVGDFIGCYFTDGQIARATSGFLHLWSLAGQHIDPDDEAEYGGYSEDAISLLGSGEEPSEPAGGQGGPATLVAAGII